MAILARGFDQTNLSGSVGGVTYRRVGGVTVASQKVPMHVTHTQTARLMLTRMKWVNLVALWKVINQTGWHPSFQRENRRVSDFNIFLRTNFPTAATFIEKDISRAYGCVIAPVRLTSGSYITPVGVEFRTGDIPVTDLSCPITIGGSTTLKAFSVAIAESNNGWLMGDKITILIARQGVVNGIPVGKASAISITLDDSDEAENTMLSDIIDVSQLGVDNGYLALTFSVNGGCACVHSRIVDGETLCSTSNLVVKNTELSAYQGLAAFNKAAESYGGIARNYLLTPDVDFDIAEHI